MSKASQQKQLQETFLRWRLHPIQFVREVLQAEPVDWQAEALIALESEDRLAVRSGHGVGKSTFEAWLILWHVGTHVPSKCLVTANTQPQLSDVIWSEMHTWLARMPEGLRGIYEMSSDKVVNTASPKDTFAAARTARKESPESMQGFHSANQLTIMDEASGIDPAIYELLQGTMTTGNSKWVLCGNPTRLGNDFHRAFKENRDQWWTRKVSSFEVREAPHNVTVKPDGTREFAIDKMAAEFEAKYGKDSNAYRVRVLGEFPDTEDDAVIPLWMLEDAVKRDVKGHGEEVWGVDVARFGDDLSALAKRRGNKLVEPVKSWLKKDNMQLAGLIAFEYETAKRKPEKIFVDAIGVGAGVNDRLRELGYPVREVNVAETKSIGESYMRRRDEIWWRAREWFQDMTCSIPEDDKLIKELSGVKYEMTSTGKIKVESKDDMRRRGLRSPNLADAFILTFAELPRNADPKWNKPLEYPDQSMSMSPWV